MANQTFNSLTVARDLAGRGFHVFPIQPKSKLPIAGASWKSLISRSVDAATTEFTKPGREHSNVAVACGADLLVVDVDEGKHPGALDSYLKLDLPQTFSVRTPSGGYHFYFRGPDVSNSASKIAPGIDIRSAGGYVVAPGSVTELGVYTVDEDIEIARASEKLLALCNASRGAGDARSVDWTTRDTPEGRLADAREFLRDARTPISVEGSAGNQTAFEVIAGLRDRGVHAAQALELVQEDWNERCLPPWSQDELRKLVTNAYSYSSGPFGSRAIDAMFGPVVLPSNEPEPAPRLETVNLYDALRTPAEPRRWLVEKLIPTNQVTLLYGDGGTGKSLLALMLAVSVTSGRPWIGHATKTGPVLYFSAEDDLNENKRRAACILDRLDIKREEAQHALVLADLSAEDATLANFDRADLIQERPLFRELSEAIRKTAPALVVLDNLADVFGGDEIKKAHVRPFVSKLRSLCSEFDTTLLVLAHPSLSGMTSGKGTSGNVAWSNSVRSRLFLRGDDAMKKDKDVRILEVMKANYAETGAATRMKWMNWCFVEIAAARVAEAEAQQEMGAKEKVLSMLARYIAEGRGGLLSMVEQGRSGYLPLAFSKDPDSQPYTKAALEIAFHALVREGAIRAQRTGSPSRPVLRPVLAEATRASCAGADLFEGGLGKAMLKDRVISFFERELVASAPAADVAKSICLFDPELSGQSARVKAELETVFCWPGVEIGNDEKVVYHRAGSGGSIQHLLTRCAVEDDPRVM